MLKMFCCSFRTVFDIYSEYREGKPIPMILNFYECVQSMLKNAACPFTVILRIKDKTLSSTWFNANILPLYDMWSLRWRCGWMNTLTRFSFIHIKGHTHSICSGVFILWLHADPNLTHTFLILPPNENQNIYLLLLLRSSLFTSIPLCHLILPFHLYAVLVHKQLSVTVSNDVSAVFWNLRGVLSYLDVTTCSWRDKLIIYWVSRRKGHDLDTRVQHCNTQLDSLISIHKVIAKHRHLFRDQNNSRCSLTSNGKT